jgi:hypothetical protein
MTGQEKVTFKYSLPLNRGDYMDRFDCNFIALRSKSKDLEAQTHVELRSKSKH